MQSEDLCFISTSPVLKAPIKESFFILVSDYKLLQVQIYVLLSTKFTFKRYKPLKYEFHFWLPGKCTKNVDDSS